jgi:hypothetical protein
MKLETSLKRGENISWPKQALKLYTTGIKIAITHNALESSHGPK